MLMSSAATATVATAARTTIVRQEPRDGWRSGVACVMIRSYQYSESARLDGTRPQSVRLCCGSGCIPGLAALPCTHVAIDGRRDVLVASAAAFSVTLVIELRDLDGVGIASAGEVERVPESVVGLDRILPMMLCGVWQSLQVAARVMTRLHPAVVLRLHHMAVGAGRGIRWSR